MTNTNMDMTMECAKSICAEFNKMYPVGSPVILIKDLGETMRTTIKYPAEVRESGGCIIFLEKVGLYKLDRVVPLSPAERLSSESTSPR